MGTRLTDEQVVEVRERYAAGARQVDLATEYGISQNTVSSIVVGRSRLAAGGPISPGKARKLLSDDVLTIREAAAAGTSITELASTYGVSKAMITNVTTGQAFADIGGPRTSPPARAVPLTTEQREAIRRRVAAGEKRPDIAAAFGISTWTVDSVMRTKNADHQPTGRRFDRDDIIRMRTLYDEGESQDDIAAEFGCDQQMVSQIVRGRMYQEFGGAIAATARRRLTHDEVEQMRTDFVAGVSLNDLATRHDLDRAVAKHVVTGKTYPSAPGPLSNVDRSGTRIDPTP